MTFPRLALSISLALAILGAADAPALARSSVDRTDARATARAVIGANRAKDLAALAKLSTGGNRRMLAEIAAKGEAHPRYRSIFRGWRWKAIQAWNGKLGRVRYAKGDPPKRVRVEFQKMGREVTVVTLDRRKGKWAFDDIHSRSEKRFQSWGRPE